LCLPVVRHDDLTNVSKAIGIDFRRRFLNAITSRRRRRRFRYGHRLRNRFWSRSWWLGDWNWIWNWFQYRRVGLWNWSR
jgi:hypothetical protein